MKEIKINRDNTISRNRLNKILEDENTINIAGILSDNQRKSKREARKQKMFIKDNLKELIILSVAFLLTLASPLFFFSKNIANANETIVTSENKEFRYYGVDNYQDYARKIRLEICNRVYFANKDWVDSTYIHDQDIVVRCATMMTLIWSYESDYFASERCIRDYNCFWIKDYNTGAFKIYDSLYEWQVDFAKKYLVGNGNNTFRWHKNRNITEFVYAWSMTDRETYIDFVSSKYWEVYNNLNMLK